MSDRSCGGLHVTTDALLHGCPRSTDRSTDRPLDRPAGRTRRRRSGSPAQHGVAKSEIAHLTGDIHLVEVTDELIAVAAELAETEGLRGYDSVHLAAALFVGATVLTSADVALCDAAHRRGLHVANPLIG